MFSKQTSIQFILAKSVNPKINQMGLKEYTSLLKEVFHVVKMSNCSSFDWTIMKITLCFNNCNWKINEYFS